MTTSSASTPLWLDCDPGHDDVFAILLAAHHPHLNLLGISTVHGNASLENCTANAARVLQAIGKSDIPLYPGAAKPFCREAVAAANIHGVSGLDGTDLLPTATTPPITIKPAILALRDALLSHPKGVAWIVATGALTNIGLLFAAFPDLVDHIAGLSIMGGAVGGRFTNAPLGHLEGREEGERIGNVTRWAEFNIYVGKPVVSGTFNSRLTAILHGQCDPEAASSIFSNPLLAAKTTLIPLDLTHQVLATQEVQQLLLHGTPLPPALPPSTTSSPPAPLLPTSADPAPSQSQPSTLRRMLHDLLTFFAHTYASVFGITAGPPLHDPLAVAVLLSNLNPSNRLPALSFTPHEAPSPYFSSTPYETHQATQPHEAHSPCTPHGAHSPFTPHEAHPPTPESFAITITTIGLHSALESESAEVGRTVVRKLAPGAMGVSIPRGVDVAAFWGLLEGCVRAAEVAVEGKRP